MPPVTKTMYVCVCLMVLTEITFCILNSIECFLLEMLFLVQFNNCVICVAGEAEQKEQAQDVEDQDVS